MRAAFVATVVAIGPGASSAIAGLWGAPATLGPAGNSASGDVAMDGSGTAVVAWAATSGALRATVRPSGGIFAQAATLAPDGAGTPAVALDGSGRALVAWSRNGVLGLAEHVPGAPGFTAVPNTVAGVQGDPDVAFVGAGTAIVVWGGADGAIHALSDDGVLGPMALPDLSVGTGNSAPRLGAAHGLAVAAWIATETAPNQLTTHIRAAVRPPGGAFGAPEDVASGTVTDENPPLLGRVGTQPSVAEVGVSEGESADVLVDDLVFQGPPGDTALEGLVAVRPPGATWTPPQRLGFADAPAQGGALTQDAVGGRDADALYVGGQKPPGSPTMTFSANARTGSSASYGQPTTLLVGALGDVRAAALAPGRFVVLMRTASVLTSRAGGGDGFDPALRFTGTDATRLLGIDGTRGGLAAAAWLTTSGSVDSAIYDDASEPGSLPPAAGRDTTAPVLSHLSLAPRRFAVRRSAQGRRTQGTRIRWRLTEPARVVLRVDRARPGFRRGSRCEAKRPRSGRVRRCTRFVRVGSFARTAPAGTTSLRFNGFVKRRALRAGSYRLTAIATDGARHTAKAKRARFSVVRG